MTEVLSKAGCFVVIIFMGWGLRRIGVFQAQDFSFLAKLVLRITLPASIIYSYSGRELVPSMLLLSAFGLGMGLVYIGLGYLISLGRSKEEKAFTMQNIAGYNVGNFTMPFAQGFLGAGGVVTLSLFDTGNAFPCLGMTYSIAAMVLRGQRFSARKLFRDLTRSVPFDVYIIMAILALLHISLPAPVTELAGIIGNANPFLAMLMLGVGFHLSGNKAQIKDIVRILSVRYSVALIAALGCFFLLPAELEMRQALAILVLSPISSASPAFTGELGGDTGLASAVNSISIVISLVLIVGTLLLTL